MNTNMYDRHSMLIYYVDRYLELTKDWKAVSGHVTDLDIVGDKLTFIRNHNIE